MSPSMKPNMYESAKEMGWFHWILVRDCNVIGRESAMESGRPILQLCDLEQCI